MPPSFSSSPSFLQGSVTLYDNKYKVLTSDSRLAVMAVVMARLTYCLYFFCLSTSVTGNSVACEQWHTVNLVAGLPARACFFLETLK